MPFGNQPVGSTGVNPVVVQPRPVEVAANPSAVQQLADAYHRGIVKITDIQKRLATNASDIGATNAQNQETATKANEQSSQPFADTRAAQNKFAGAAANAATGLVPGQAGLAQDTLHRQQADLMYGDAIKNYQQYAPLFGKPPTITDASGQPDYAAMARESQSMTQGIMQREIASRGLQVAKEDTLTDSNGAVHKIQRNALGEDVTPPMNGGPGSPAWNRYNQILISTPFATSSSPGMPGQAPVAQPAQPQYAPQFSQPTPQSQPAQPAPASIVQPAPQSQPAVSPVPASAVQPKTMSDMSPNFMRDQLVLTGISRDVLDGMNDHDVLDQYEAAQKIPSMRDRMVQPLPGSYGTPANGLPAPSLPTPTGNVNIVQPKTDDLVYRGQPAATDGLVYNPQQDNVTSQQMVQPLASPPDFNSAPASGGTAQVSSPEYDPTKGALITAPQGQFSTPQSIVDELHKQKSYEAWDQQKGFANTFMTTAKQIAAMSPQQQRATAMNTHDLSLAESLIKMYDPQGTIREFKWDKMADNQPLAEILQNAAPMLLRKGSFTPESRARVIQLGLDTVAAKQDAIAPQIKVAAQRMQAAGIDPHQHLDEMELGAAAGQHPSISGPGYQPQGGQTTSGGTQKVIQLPSGKRVYWGPDGQLYPAQ